MTPTVNLLRRRAIARFAGVRLFRRAILPVSLALAAVLASDSAPVDAQTPKFEVTEKSITELQRAMSLGQVTSRQLVQAYLDRIAAYDQKGPALNAMSYINPKALTEAEALDRERSAGRVRGPLHGIPVIVKDNYDTADMPTQNGSASMKGVIPPDDAYLVTRLRDNGAVIIGKTNMHEFARGITSLGSLFGQVRNPYNTGRNPGGSSGGTGAAVAASLATVGMGSDTCGSIRLPAAQNNLVGIRVTLGLSSRDGIIPLALTQDVGGPIGRTVEDVAIVLDATAGADPADAITQRATGRIPKTYLSSLDKNGLRGLRVGYLADLYGPDQADYEVAEVVNRAVAQMAVNGADIRWVVIPDLSSMLAGSGVIPQEWKFQFEDYLAKTPNARLKTLRAIYDSGQFHESLRAGIETALALPALDSPDYRARLAMRERLKAATLKALADQNLDVLVYPSIRRKAQLVGETQPGSNCQLSAHTGLPAISVPAGFTPDGMPVGVEFLGKEFDEPTLLKAGYAFEQITRHRKPPESTPALAK
jgi:Asp-tRNA(Asn)/Glu-tRNA(Gln) amidotransferase A subunit family amidase